MRPARADDYSEPLRGKIERGEIEPPDKFVIEDREPVCPECWTTLIGPHEDDKWCPHCKVASGEERQDGA